MTDALPSVPNIQDRQLRIFLQQLRSRVQSVTATAAGSDDVTGLRGEFLRAIADINNRIGSGGSGVGLSNSLPRALGGASVAGNDPEASRSDHVHPFPSASDVGAEAEGAIDAHEAEENPHPQYGLVEDSVSNSRYFIPEGEVATIPAGHNLLLLNTGLDLEGDLVLEGDLFELEVG